MEEKDPPVEPTSADDQVVVEGTAAGLVPPELDRRVHPRYTSEARRKELQGTVVLRAIVSSDGTVGSVRVSESLDLGLDLKAIDAVRRWRYVPGSIAGEAVDVVTHIDVDFTLWRRRPRR